MIDEEISRSTIAISVRASKLTARGLAYALGEAAKKIRKSQAPQGKQTVKQLIGQNQGVSNIEINDPSIREFDRIARKYGVDYAIKRDKSSNPPKFLIFFKSRDADALTSAFNEYAGKKVRKASRPSVLQRLASFKERVKNTVVNREKRKERER